MINMNQGDLFNLIVKLNFSTQINIARALCSCSDISNALEVENIAQCISRVKNNKKEGKPLSSLINNLPNSTYASRLFTTIFKDCDLSQGADSSIVNTKFLEIKNYLKNNQLTFPGKDDSSEVDVFIKRMILESIQHHKLHTDLELSTNIQNSSLQQLNTSISPVLHSQTIFCPSTFYGREDYLSKMHEILKSYKLVVLCGIGGIGKTYLSRQYAHQYSSEYNCEQIVTYDKNSKSIKKTILSLEFDKFNDSDMSASDKIEKRISLLNNMSEDTLLIIDNIDSKPSDIKCFDDLRTNSNIHIIVTTRLTDCFPANQTIFVTQMPIQDQLFFFNMHYHDVITEEELPIIENILKCIDGHTLLIELVAKSMYASALSPAQMLAYLRGNTSDTELLPVPISKDNLSSDKRTMDGFVKLLFDVGYLDNDAKESLLYLSLLPVEGVGRRFFYNLMPKYREAFNELISNSWAIDDNHSIRLHPVIRDMIRKEMKPSINNCMSVMTNLHSHLQTQGSKIPETEKIDICKMLRSINDIDDFYINCNNITMLSFFAEFCFNSYDFNLALNLYIIAADIAVDSPIQTRTDLYLKIGDVYKRLALLDDSVISYKKALESNARQQAGAEKDLQDADIYLLLSDIYRKDGQYDLAMQSNDTAIAIYENDQNKADSSKLAEIYNRRGIIFLNKAESKGIEKDERIKLLESALFFYKKGLDLRIDCHDTNRQLAYSYHNMGTAYNKLGDYGLARKNHEEALHLRENSPDVPKTDIASSHVWIGNDYMSQGDVFMELAKSHFEKSLEIREAILGKTHPEVAWSLMSLSEWYKKSGDYTTALSFAERAYKIRIDKYAPTHDYVLKSVEQIEKLKNIIGF